MRISDWSSDVCSSDLGPVGLAARAGDRLPHPLLRIEVGAALVVDRELHRRASHDAALPRSAASRDHVEQGRLAGTVRADDAETLAWVEGQVEAPEEPAVAVAIAYAVQLDHLVPEPRGLDRSEEHTSELQSLMRSSSAVF